MTDSNKKVHVNNPYQVK